MAAAGKGTGVKPMGNGIQVNLRIAGKRIRPTLDLPPTAANLKHAERYRRECEDEIRLGIFDLAARFPGYRHTATVAPLTGKRPTTGKTFGDVADLYLKLYGPDLEYSTRRGYERILNHHWRPSIGTRPIAAITDEEIVDVRDALGLSAKTWNNVLIPLRRVFAVAVAKKLITNDPLALIKNRRVQKPLPDPFDVDEALVIIETMRTRCDDESADYFDFAFATGLRTGEQVGLEWEQIDLRKGEMKIDRSVAWGREKDTTKTFVERIVELNPRALAILTRQKARTVLAGGRVFLNPETGRPYPSDRKIFLRWQRTLKLAKIRYRKPYNTRASSVSWNLMTGRNPLWVANQHGHSVATMMTNYAKWVGVDGAAAAAFFANERAETGQKKTA